MKCEHCGEPVGLDLNCQQCCDHSDMDNGECLDCGADRTEDLMNAAHEQSEGMER